MMGECLIMRRGGGGGGSTPDGMTAVPLNDVRTWVRCAGMNHAYIGSPTLAEVVANVDVCNALMNNQNALEYLYRSFDIQMAVFGSETALAALDASVPFESPIMTSNVLPDGYTASASSYRTDNNAYLPYMVTSETGCWMASGGVTSAWIQIDLPQAVWPYRLRWAASANAGSTTIDSSIKGSVDGSTWADLTDVFSSSPTNTVILPDVHECTPNTGATKMAHYRVQVSINSSTGYLKAAHFKIHGKS